MLTGSGRYTDAREVGADGRDAEEFEQLAEETVFIFILVVFPSLHGDEFFGRRVSRLCGPDEPIGGKYRFFEKTGGADSGGGIRFAVGGRRRG